MIIFIMLNVQCKYFIMNKEGFICVEFKQTTLSWHFYSLSPGQIDKKSVWELVLFGQQHLSTWCIPNSLLGIYLFIIHDICLFVVCQYTVLILTQYFLLWG